ncbi:hypothetical protein BDQ17DRAFT_1366530 [Cyathus striatus]|nr:hypothetical protein BDQ17DRAFT_1366530 [Cyathus striatus]
MEIAYTMTIAGKVLRTCQCKPNVLRTSSIIPQQIERIPQQLEIRKLVISLCNLDEGNTPSISLLPPRPPSPSVLIFPESSASSIITIIAIDKTTTQMNSTYEGYINHHTPPIPCASYYHCPSKRKASQSQNGRLFMPICAASDRTEPPGRVTEGTSALARRIANRVD